MLNKLNKLLPIALILVLQGCGRNATDTPKPQTKVLIGILDVRFKAGAEKFRDAFAKRLGTIQRAVPEQNISFVIEYPPFEGDMAAAAKRLVAKSPDILIAINDDAALALGAVTKNIPVVFQSYDDPVAKGIVPSLTEPKFNLTGYNFYRRTHLKRWEILLQVAPETKKIGVLLDPEYVPTGILEDMQRAKTGLGLHVVPLYLSQGEPIASLESKLSTAQIDALDLPHNGHFTMSQKKTVAEITKLKRPTSYDGNLYCSWGGTVCFARENTPTENLAADYVKLILNGALPSEIPVSSPAKYELSINMTTIKSLGLRPPHSIMSIARIYE